LKTIVTSISVALLASSFAAGAMGAGRATPKQQLASYLTAFAAARNRPKAFYPQVKAAVADMSSISYSNPTCSSETTSTLLRYQTLLHDAGVTLDKVNSKRRIPAIYGSLHYGYTYYKAGIGDAMNFYGQLAGVCDQLSSDDSTNDSYALQTLQRLSQQSAARFAAINAKLGQWRQAVVGLAHRLHAPIPGWVYSVGVSG
jgi:hypothetical protein